MARVTGLEPAASGVTGRRSNQLSYTRETPNGWVVWLPGHTMKNSSFVSRPTNARTENGQRIFTDSVCFFGHYIRNRTSGLFIYVLVTLDLPLGSLERVPPPLKTVPSFT